MSLLTSLQEETKLSADELKIGDNRVEEEHEEWLHPHTNYLVAPDLELSLAVSKAKTMEKDKKASSSSFLLGPITVT